MAHQQRAKKLDGINITKLLNSIFNHSVSLVNMGNDELERNRVYLIKEYNYILKIYGDNSRWRNEIKFISKLNKCSFRVPEVITFGMFEDVGWVIIEKLQGDLLIDKYNESSCLDKEKIWHNIGEKLREFHEKNKLKEDYIYVTKENQIKKMRYEEYVSKKIEKFKYAIRNNNQINHYDTYEKCFSVIDIIFNKNIIRNNGELTICHNDFNIRNILLNEKDGQFSLIDFETAFIGEKESDLVLILIDNYGNSNKKAFFKGYYKNDNLYEKYEEKINLYLLIKCIEICSWAYTRANDYYNKAFNTIKETIKKIEENNNEY